MALPALFPALPLLVGVLNVLAEEMPNRRVKGMLRASDLPLGSLAEWTGRAADPRAASLYFWNTRDISDAHRLHSGSNLHQGT